MSLEHKGVAAIPSYRVPDTWPRTHISGDNRVTQNVPQTLSHRFAKKGGAGTYLVQRFGRELRCPKQVSHWASGGSGSAKGDPGGLRGPGTRAPARGARAAR